MPNKIKVYRLQLTLILIRINRCILSVFPKRSLLGLVYISEFLWINGMLKVLPGPSFDDILIMHRFTCLY